MSMENNIPILSIVTVGLIPSDIITTLDPFYGCLNDPRIELIIVTPPENTAHLSKYSAATIVVDQHQGVYQAMNLGMHASTGQYLWFLNSGDKSLLNSCSLSALITDLSILINRPVKSTVIIFGFRPLGLEASYFARPLANFIFKLLFFLSTMPVSHQNIIVRRLDHMPFSLLYKYTCDFEVLASLLSSQRHRSTLFFSKKPIAKLSAGGISDSNRLAVFRERYAIMKKLAGSWLRLVVVIGFGVRLLREVLALKVKSIKLK